MDASRARATLFRRREVVHDDRIKCKAGQSQNFPFSLTFPETAGDRTPVIEAAYKQDQRFAFAPGDPLPPSYRCNYYDLAEQIYAFVEYRIGVEITMPEMEQHVFTHVPEKDEEDLVLYEHPALPKPVDQETHQWSGQVSARSDQLLREEDRPSGFGPKMKARLHHGAKPTYAFNWSLIDEKHLYIRSSTSLELSIRVREDECTATGIPEVLLAELQICLVGSSQVRAEIIALGSPESHVNDEFAVHTSINLAKPFSKFNDFKKAIITVPIGIPEHGFPGAGKRLASFRSSSKADPSVVQILGRMWQPTESLASFFQTYNINQSYKLKHRLVFKVADQSKVFTGMTRVVLHPPIEAPSFEGNAWTGRSSDMANAEAMMEEEDLPSYRE